MNRTEDRLVKNPLSGLNPRHHKVVDAYFLNNFNKTKACEKAGYANPAQQATAIFSRADVQAEIQRRMYLNAQAWKIDENWVIERLSMIANGNLGQVITMLKQNGHDVAALPPELQFALSEYTEEVYMEGTGEDAQPVKKLKVKTRDQLGALMALCRHLGMFQDTLDLRFEQTMVERMQAGRNRVAAEHKRGMIDITPRSTGNE